MTQYVINIGTIPNDGTGDPLRTAFNEVNLNFDQVFAAGPVLSNIQIANNTILTTNTNGNLVLAPNGIGVVQANVNIVPNASNIRNLGAADRRWSTIYVQYANVSGGLTVANLTATGDVTVGGNLSVTGNIINVANIITDAKTIQLANTAVTANAADGSGITVGANDAIATFLFDSANTAWATNIGLQVGGPITGTSIAVSDATIYGNTTGIDALFTGTTTTPNIVVNNISSDDSTFVTVEDGLDVQGDIAAETLSLTGTITSGNILPRANVTYSLGNSTLWWSNVWVAGNTIYIGGVPIGMSAGNVLTVDGNAVLQNDSNTTISTTGNITADYFFGNGSQLTGLNTSSISNGTSNVDIPTANGNITITAAGVDTWTFDTTGNLSVPNNINFDGVGIQHVLNEDFYTRVSDDEDEGWAIYNAVDDGAGNVLAQTRVDSDGFYVQTDVADVNYQWNFDSLGRLNLPGNISGVYGGDNSYYAYDNGSGGMVEIKTISYIGDQLLANVTVRHPNVTISTQNAAYNWTFDGTGNLTVPGNITTTLGPGAGNIVGNVRTWDSAGANLYVWFDAAETPEIVELNTISGGNVDGWLVQVDGGNQALITATNPAGFFSISTNQALTGSGTLTFSSPDYEPPAPNPLTIQVGDSGWIFDQYGELTLPGQGQYVIGETEGGLAINSSNEFYINTDSAESNYTWRFDTSGQLRPPAQITGEGEGESITIRGSRTIVGGLNNVVPYVVEIPGHTEFGNIAWQATNSLTQSARLTFVVQSNGAAFQWEQFDVTVCQLDGANCVVTVSNRIKQNSAIADTEVTAYNSEGGPQIWLNPAAGQTIAYVNYTATEFQIMVD